MLGRGGSLSCLPEKLLLRPLLITNFVSHRGGSTPHLFKTQLCLPPTMQSSRTGRVVLMMYYNGFWGGRWRVPVTCHPRLLKWKLGLSIVRKRKTRPLDRRTDLEVLPSMAQLAQWRRRRAQKVLDDPRGGRGNMTLLAVLTVRGGAKKYQKRRGKKVQKVFHTALWRKFHSIPLVFSHC